jgi:hypothetical protein
VARGPRTVEHVNGHGPSVGLVRRLVIRRSGRAWCSETPVRNSGKPQLRCPYSDGRCVPRLQPPPVRARHPRERGAPLRKNADGNCFTRP